MSYVCICKVPSRIESLVGTPYKCILPVFAGMVPVSLRVLVLEAVAQECLQGTVLSAAGGNQTIYRRVGCWGYLDGLDLPREIVGDLAICLSSPWRKWSCRLRESSPFTRSRVQEDQLVGVLLLL